MGKLKTNFDETREHLRSEMERTDAEIHDMERALKVKQNHARSLRKAFLVLGGAVDSPPSESVTLDHVNKAILAAFGNQDHMPEPEIRTRVLNTLKADPTVSSHGVGLRVAQGMKRLKRNTEGLVLRPGQ